MNVWMPDFWQLNIELSLLLAAILSARYLMRRTTRNYNAYLLWLSVPAAVLFSALATNVQFSQPPAPAVSNLVQAYVVVPAAAATDWAAFGQLWLWVAIALIGRLVWQHRQLRAQLRAITTPMPIEINAQYPVIGIDQPEFSPAVYGFIKPRIYFPVHLLQKLSRDQIALIIEHEEHHIKQQHLWLNLAWDVLVCLLWFNPFVYWSRRSFRHDQELYCDYLVLHEDRGRKQQSYGHALLSTVAATHSVSLLCSWKSINHLEERIMNIKQSASPLSKLLMAFFGLVIIAVSSIYAVSAHEPEQGAKQVKRIVKKMHDDGAHKEIELRLNDKTFVQKGDQKMIMENGVSRPMSEQEMAEFEREMQAVDKNTQMNFSGGPMHKEIRIMRGSEGDMSEFDIEMDAHSKELMAGDMQQIEIEMIRSEHEIDHVERALNQAINELEAAKAADLLSAKEVRKARKQLEKSKAQLAKDRANMQQSMQQAQAELKRARAELEAKRKQAH
ncbi:MAG: hypothetical protein HKN50_11450 [Gammaproteobacteria bacterium]|nr:hypothetical protein [Gammaproteobacteria bacterium]